MPASSSQYLRRILILVSSLSSRSFRTLSCLSRCASILHDTGQIRPDQRKQTCPDAQVEWQRMEIAYVQYDEELQSIRRQSWPSAVIFFAEGAIMTVTKPNRNAKSKLEFPYRTAAERSAFVYTAAVVALFCEPQVIFEVVVDRNVRIGLVNFL
jgi:hypothetical protein